MIDALGHPITKGCTVLTAPYWSPKMSIIVKVEKVTKTAVEVTVTGHEWYLTTETVGGWKQRAVTKTLRRKPDQVLVIDKQLKHNRKTYPEHMV